MRLPGIVRRELISDKAVIIDWGKETSSLRMLVIRFEACLCWTIFIKKFVSWNLMMSTEDALFVIVWMHSLQHLPPFYWGRSCVCLLNMVNSCKRKLGLSLALLRMFKEIFKLIVSKTLWTSDCVYLLRKGLDGIFVDHVSQLLTWSKAIVSINFINSSSTIAWYQQRMNFLSFLDLLGFFLLGFWSFKQSNVLVVRSELVNVSLIRWTLTFIIWWAINDLMINNG